MTTIEYGYSNSTANAKLTLARDFAAIDRASAGLFGTVGALARRMLRTFLVWNQRAAERRQLLGMTNRDLRDIGLTRLDATVIANKPFWQD